MANIADLYDLALRSHQGGNLRQAEALCREILQADPSQADVYHLLGVLEYQSGQHDAAIDAIDQAIALKPSVAAFHCHLGLALKEQGRLMEAIESYRRALLIDPQLPQVLINLGLALVDHGQIAEAVACYRQALQINPDDADVHFNLGNAKSDQGESAEAIACYREAVRLNPQFVDALCNLGLALRELGQLPEAIACYSQAYRVNRFDGNVLNNLGNALREQGNTMGAIACYHEALRLNPEFVHALHNLGIAYEDEMRLDKAGPCFEQALGLKPDYHSARWHLSVVRLLQGELAAGWPGYEARFQLGIKLRHLGMPRWDGSPLRDRTILLYADQGLGDTIQFIRYASLIKKSGGIVLVECQPVLTRLLGQVAGVDEVVPMGTLLPPFDVQAALLSLPGILGTTLDTIPADIPLLSASSDLIERWGQELKPLGGFKIGIAWQGSPTHAVDRYRSCSLMHFEGLSQVAEVRLVSLQVGSGRDQLAAASFPIVDLGKRFDRDSLEDLAAALMNLDLVITVDTAVAHLAGALGKPVWVALPFVPDWRWLLEREDSPWYPTMRLFRQQRRLDWDDVFERIAAAVRHLLEKMEP